MKAVSVILYSIFVFGEASGDDGAPTWSYDHETEWPGYCNKGTRQSPINIMSRSALEDKFQSHIRGPLEFYGYETVRLQAKNNAHTIQWVKVIPEGSLALEEGEIRREGSDPILSGGPLRGNYSFLQFHLHWLSEHAIDGRKYPLEIHFVHLKQGLSVDEARARDDGIAVIGVMCEIHSGFGGDLALSDIIQDVPSLVHRGSKSEQSRIIDLNPLFSPFRQSYFTYHGSLTTPGCEQVVTWIVMDKPIFISDEQFQLISKVDVGTINNYRSLQPVNRVVYRANPIANCAHILTPTFLATLAALVNCFSSHLTKAMKKGICVLYYSKNKLFGSSKSLNECAMF